MSWWKRNWFPLSGITVIVALAGFLVATYSPASTEPTIGFITFSALHESVQCAYVRETLEIIFCEGLGNR